MTKLKFLESPLGKLVVESLRWGVLAFATAVVGFLLENLGGLNLDPTFYLLLTAGLRFADSALHKTGVAEKGLTRF